MPQSGQYIQNNQIPQNGMGNDINQLSNTIYKSNPKKKSFLPKIPKLGLIFGGLLLIILILVLIIYLVSVNNQKPITPTIKNITFWARNVDPDVMNEIINAFQLENPYIKVKYEQQLETNYEEKIKTRLQNNSSNMGNIVEIEESWIDDIYSSAGIIEDQNILKNFSKASIDNNSYLGFMFAMPFEFDSILLAYNPKHISELGYSEESFNKLDWSILSSRVKNLTKTSSITSSDGKTKLEVVDRAGLAIGSPNTVKNASEILQLLLIQNDADEIYNVDTKKFDLKNERVQEILEFYENFTHNSIWDSSVGKDIDGFINGKVSMVLIRSSDIDYIIQKNPNFEFKTSLPGQIGSIKTISLSKSLILPSYLPNYAESLKFLEYLSRPEIGFKLHQESDYKSTFIPAQAESLNMIDSESHYAIFSDLNPNSKKFNMPYYFDTSLGINNFLQSNYDKYESAKLKSYSSNNPPKINLQSSSLESELNKILNTKSAQ